jgi:sugar-specific transcriptional regulator TrmB
MDIQLLEDIGLTNVQARTYKTLIEYGTSTAPAIAKRTNESRSNTYKILDRLCELGLASKDNSLTKICYTPSSPAVLEQFIQTQTSQLHGRERKLQAGLPDMLDYFFAHSEQASIRYFQGKTGIQQIFTDMLKTGQTIYLLRSPSDVAFYDEAFFADFRKRRARLGIQTYALTPDVPSAVHDPVIDQQNRFIRTWMPADAYDGSVEWDIYGNKVALISYGQEAMGIIIESPKIADSFKQMFSLLQLGCTPKFQKNAGSPDIA